MFCIDADRIGVFLFYANKSRNVSTLSKIPLFLIPKVVISTPMVFCGENQYNGTSPRYITWLCRT